MFIILYNTFIFIVLSYTVKEKKNHCQVKHHASSHLSYETHPDFRAVNMLKICVLKISEIQQNSNVS